MNGDRIYLEQMVYNTGTVLLYPCDVLLHRMGDILQLPGLSSKLLVVESLRGLVDDIRGSARILNPVMVKEVGSIGCPLRCEKTAKAVYVVRRRGSDQVVR